MLESARHRLRHERERSPTATRTARTTAGPRHWHRYGRRRPRADRRPAWGPARREQRRVRLQLAPRKPSRTWRRVREPGARRLRPADRIPRRAKGRTMPVPPGWPETESPVPGQEPRHDPRSRCSNSRFCRCAGTAPPTTTAAPGRRLRPRTWTEALRRARIRPYRTCRRERTREERTAHRPRRSARRPSAMRTAPPLPHGGHGTIRSRARRTEAPLPAAPATAHVHRRCPRRTTASHPRRRRSLHRTNAGCRRIRDRHRHNRRRARTIRDG